MQETIFGILAAADVHAEPHGILEAGAGTLLTFALLRRCRIEQVFRLRHRGAVRVDEPAHELLGESRPIRELRKLLQRTVRLELFVKVEREWSRSESMLRRLGYEPG